MITIALDEQGDFENLEGKIDNAPVFIGGVLYDDFEDITDYENEKNRLQKYLKNVCCSVECRYPQDMHCSSLENNSYKVAKVKKQFSKTIKEFMEKGTFNGAELIREPRKGQYRIFSLLRGEDGKKNLLSPDVSQAVKDDFASNLYVHMAEDVVDRLIFHNPVVDNVSKVRLELATRRVLLSGADMQERMKQYDTLGFRPVCRETGVSTQVTEYLLTNPDNYRTAVEREMLNCGQNKILIDRIGVKSIYYQNQKSGMDFLYLADAICSFLAYEIDGNKPSLWIDRFYERSKKINVRAENIIWAYDEVDDMFTRAWKYYEEKDYYRALSTAFEGMRYKSDMTPYYEKVWFKYIGEYISKAEDASGFAIAVKKYKESLLNNNLNQEKMVYIFKYLELMSKNLKFANQKEEAVLYDLYDCGISAYIHNSNLEKVQYCFEKAKQYAEYIATEIYLRTRNKMVVFLCDNFMFDKALVLADENVTYHELLTQMKKEMFGESFTESLNHAIAISQKAQVMAFLNNEEAEQAFLQALSIMDEGTPDRYITQSYLLHYYICNGLKEKYEQHAAEYFGNHKILIEQFNYIAKEGSKNNARISMKYALYVYIKAVYTFYADELPAKLLNKLKNVEKALTDVNRMAQKQINGHPWELIYKYLALIMDRYNYENEVERYKNSLEMMFQNAEGLIKLIADESIRSITEKTETSNFTFMYY